MITKYLIIVVLLTSLVYSRRIRYRIRTECRDISPRKVADLSEVVLTGYVEQVYPSLDEGLTYTGSIYVKRVLKGSKVIQGRKVTIGGFGDNSLCYSNVTKGESWVFFLSQISDGFFRLNGSLHKPNIQIMDRLNALVTDKIYRRRADIIEKKCETIYCENNAICIEEKTDIGILSRARCECLSYCPSNYDPVCGSNKETFANECKLRMESCKRGINLFVRFLGPCESGPRS